MNITHVCSYYYGSKVYQNLFQNLNDKGVKSEVFVPYRNKHFADMSEKAVERFVSCKCLNLFTRLFYSLKLLTICMEYLKRKIGKNSNLIHAHTLYSDGIPSYLCNMFNKKTFIITVRNTDVNLGFYFFFHFKWLARLALRRSNAILFISPSHKELFNSYFGNSYEQKTHVVPNGIDEIFLKNIKKNLKPKKRKNSNAIFVGQIDKNKNIKKAILAYSDVKRQEDWKFTVVGGCYEQFVNCFGELPTNIKNRTEFVGRVALDEILKHLEEANLFIMPSYRETFGLVYIEAISQCTPVVYTKGQGIDGYFKEGVIGYSCNPKSMISIKKAINKANIHFPEGLFFDKQNPAKEFDWEVISSRYVELYRSFLS